MPGEIIVSHSIDTCVEKRECCHLWCTSVEQDQCFWNCTSLSGIEARSLCHPHQKFQH
jgi:hypothetical protein